MIYIGIDNGLDGGIVAIGPQPGTAPILCAAMPTCKVSGNREVKPAELFAILRDFDELRCTVLIEECPKHSKSKAAMRSMAMSFGMIFTAATRFCLARDWSIVRVQSGTAKTSWQRAMLGSVPKGGTKERALEVAKEIWPDEDWILPGRKKPHDGCIDAALIAEFGRRKGER